MKIEIGKLPLLMVLSILGACAPALRAQCSTCTYGTFSIPGTVATVHSEATPSAVNTPASSRYGKFAVTITAASGPLPANLPAGVYAGWCGTKPIDSPPNGAYLVTSDPGQLNPQMSQKALGRINYILNHRQGTVSDVQDALWAVLGEDTVTTSPVNRSFLVNNNLNVSLAMFDAAVTNGQAQQAGLATAWFPTAGSTVAALIAAKAGEQNLIIETVLCGQLGDRVWLDTNRTGTGSTDVQEPGEPGINGVVVDLYSVKADGTVGSYLTSVTTKPSPPNYPYLPVGTDGFYQFTGLCPGTSYAVRVDPHQTPVLQNLTPVVQGAGSTTDSDGDPNTGFAIVPPLPMTNPSVNPTIDFGYYQSGNPPGYPVVTCPGTPWYARTTYSSPILISGGTAPYNFTVTGQPLGLEFDYTTNTLRNQAAQTGDFTIVIAGSDASSPAQNFSVSCPLHINPQPISFSCPTASSISIGSPVVFDTPAAGGSKFGPFWLTGGSGQYGVRPTGQPAGMQIAPDGSSILWTPQAAGKYNFFFAAWDAAQPANTVNAKLSDTCVLTVPPPSPTIDCPPISDAHLGQTYSSNFQYSGSSAAYTFSVTGTLPTGVTQTGSSSMISGAPSATGTFTFGATLLDGGAPVASVSGCKINVTSSFTIGCIGGTGQVGSLYTASLQISGSTPSDLTITATGLPTWATFSNGVLSGTPTAPGTYTIKFTITSSTLATPLVQSCDIVVPNPPTIRVNCATVTLQQGVSVPANTYLSASGGAGRLHFSSSDLPAGLTLADNGQLGGMPLAAGTLSFHVTVTDDYGDTTATSADGCLTIVSNPAPILTAQCATATGTVGGAYTSRILVSGGVPAYSFALTSGPLPPSLKLNADGTITGTLTGADAGTWNYTVAVTDSALGAAHVQSTQGCSIYVPPAVDLSLACMSNATAQAGQPYSSQLVANGGTSPYQYSILSGQLPAGLTLNSNGTISGTPTTSTQTPATFTAQVQDSAHFTALTKTATCGIGVTNPVDLKVQCAAATGKVGVPYSSSLVVTGGVPFPSAPYYHFVLNGTLPPGLQFDANTGTIYGSPVAAAAGTWSYSVSVSDANGNGATTVSTNCQIVIQPAVDLSLACMGAAGQAGVPYSASLLAAGGTKPYTFSAGPLPAGLGFDPATGLISGTPTTSQSVTVLASVRDSANMAAFTASKSCPITIAPPAALSVQCAATTGVVGVTYSSRMTVAGGVAPYQFALTAGALPPGLNLYPDGTITGIPLSAGTATYTVTVTDSTGGTAQVSSTQCQIQIVPPTPKIACPPVTTIQEGQPYSSAPVVTDGVAPYTYAITSGFLPFGLKLDPNTGMITGMSTTAGTYSFTITVTDANLRTASTNCTIIVTPPPSTNKCGLTWGYWKNHISAWPILTLTLGSQTYSQSELMNLLGLPVSNDASLNLAHQLIAAKLNVFAGTDSTTDHGAIYAADALLAAYSGKLPYNEPSSSANGSQMVTLAGTLDTFNQDGAGQPGCVNGPTNLKLVCAASTGVVGMPYSSAVVASGGMGGPFTYAITSGTLPAGLTLNPDGTISGTPTAAGTFNFTVTAYDSSWVSGSTGSISSNCSMTIATPPSANCVTINATQGVAITPVAMVASGGAGGPYTFSATGLPAGLSMSSNGTISGTPTVSGGPFNYTVTIKDAAGNVGTVNCSVTVTTTPISTSCVVINAIQGVSFSAQLTATGGTGSYTYTLISGPTWLKVSTTGAISGTPDASGSIPYSVLVTDNAGNKSTLNCSITVVPPPTVICPLAAGGVGLAYNSGILVSGGSGSFSFTATGLPAGLTLNTSTGAITGTPTASGTYSVTITVTDKVLLKTYTTTCTISIVAGNACGLTWGYWKNHVSLWPIDTMTLGPTTYDKAALQKILSTSVSGDVSVELAHQLIAAKFNVLNGTNSATANGAIAAADNLLIQAQATTSAVLPNLKIASSSTIGAQMVSTASQLNTFNSDGKAQPGCTMFTGGCTGSIGNFVWLDWNKDGIQTLGEPGLAGVTVKLYDQDYNLLKTTTTDSTGQYQFTGLCAGTYIVVAVAPAGYAPTLPFQGAGSDRDSNQSPTTVVLTTGNSSSQDVDFGFMQPNCSGVIGNFVWRDSNANGVQDSGEPGIGGVLLSLYNSSGVVIQTAITDALGAYQFTGVCAGNYWVVPTTPPGYAPSPTLAGKDTSKDSNPVGVDYPTNLATNTSSDLTVDFGFKHIDSTATGYTTYTQGGWGAVPHGNNAGSLLDANFDFVYGGTAGTSLDTIGGNVTVTFTSAAAVRGFLPQGGTPGTLAGTANSTDPTTTPAGVLAGQVLALDISVDFSNKKITKPGLAGLKCVTGKLAGKTVQDVLTMANKVLGGDLTALPIGVSVSDLNSVLDSINQNFDGGTVNKGYLQ